MTVGRMAAKWGSGPPQNVSLTFNQLIPNDVQIFVTEHDRHNHRHNRTSVQALITR